MGAEIRHYTPCDHGEAKQEIPSIGDQCFQLRHCLEDSARYGDGFALTREPVSGFSVRFTTKRGRDLTLDSLDDRRM